MVSAAILKTNCTSCKSTHAHVAIRKTSGSITRPQVKAPDDSKQGPKINPVPGAPPKAPIATRAPVKHRGSQLQANGPRNSKTHLPHRRIPRHVLTSQTCPSNHLQPLQWLYRVPMEPPKCIKSEGAENDPRRLPRQLIPGILDLVGFRTCHSPGRTVPSAT
jgi:hypothetical protein